MRLIAVRWSARIAGIAVAALAAVEFGADLTSAADNPIVYKALFEQKCSACHNLPDPTVNQNTQDRWRSIVATMAGRAQGAITPDDQSHIVAYLGLFPPKPSSASHDPLAVKHEDVWDRDPSRSLVCTLMTPDQLARFRAVACKPAPSAAPPAPLTDGIVFAAHQGTDALLIANADPFSGGLDLRVSVRFPAGASNSRAAGIVFGRTDARNYLEALLDTARSEVRIVQCRDGSLSTLSAAPVLDFDDRGGWHVVKVILRPDGNGAKATIWVDATKRLAASLPSPIAAGSVGLAATTGTSAGFKDFYADEYAP